MADDVENIIELLGPHEVIGQAIRHLMARDDMSRDAAFELLVQTSTGAHRKVRETAAEIIQQRKGDSSEPSSEPSSAPSSAETES